MINETARLAKRLSELGLCSRREGEEFIEKGWVFVNGQVVTEVATKVSYQDKIELSPLAKFKQEKLATIILNKPIGYVSAQPEKGYRPAIELITEENQDAHFEGPQLKPSNFKGLAVAGRLDIDSQGLLIFTQDGRIAKKLIGEDCGIEKEYLVRVEGHLPKEKLQLLNHGLELDGKKLKPAKVEWINEDQLRFVLKEGKKRQIRRMCDLVGLKVTGLKRVRVGKVMLGALKEGSWRFLLPGEEF